MKRRRIFNNAIVTEMMREFSRRPKNLKLRNKILKKVYPLVEAAMSKKRIYVNRDDVRQECLLKVMQALPKFDADRGSAFAFLWTTICNTCISINQRLCRPGLSLSSDEDIAQEAEASSTAPYDSPANRLILTQLSDDIQLAFATNGFQVPARRAHRKVLLDIRSSVQSGELFYNRSTVMRRLRKYGLKSDDVRYYLDYTMVVVRRKLLDSKENVRAITPRQIGKDLPTDVAE